MSARAACPGKDCRLFRAVQLRCQIIEFRPVGNNLGPRIAAYDPLASIRDFGERNIARYYHHGNAASRHGRLDRCLENPRHLRGIRDEFAVVTALLE